MKTLYTWSTPNGRKVSIALEEMGFKYQSIAVDITKNEQFKPDFLSINPNNKIPSLVESDGTVINESNNILLYLAEQSGQFMPAQNSQEYRLMMQWLMWQASSFGPILGQAHHFLHYNLGKSEYSEQRYYKETCRLYERLDQHLTNRDYVLTDLSIVEFAIWPWVARYSYHRIDLNNFPAVKSWYQRLSVRSAFERGYSQPKFVEPIPVPN